MLHFNKTIISFVNYLNVIFYNTVNYHCIYLLLISSMLYCTKSIYYYQGRRQDFSSGGWDIGQNFKWRRHNFGSKKTLNKNLLNKDF